MSDLDYDALFDRFDDLRVEDEDWETNCQIRRSYTKAVLPWSRVVRDDVSSWVEEMMWGA